MSSLPCAPGRSYHSPGGGGGAEGGSYHHRNRGPDMAISRCDSLLLSGLLARESTLWQAVRSSRLWIFFQRGEERATFSKRL